MPRDERGPGATSADGLDAGRAMELEQDLRDRLAELAGINAIGIALGSTLRLDELVERGLAEIVGRLGLRARPHGIRGPGTRTIGSCRVAGGPPGLTLLVADLEVSLDDEASSLAALARAEGPLRFRDVDRDAHEGNRRLAAVLGSPGSSARRSSPRDASSASSSSTSDGTVATCSRRTVPSSTRSPRCSPARSSRRGCTRSSRPRTAPSSSASPTGRRTSSTP